MTENGLVKVLSKVKVEITDVLPDTLKKKQYEIIVTIYLDGMKRENSNECWFPLEKGSIFLAAFNQEKLEIGNDLYQLVSDDEVETGWRECKRFYKIVTGETKAVPKRLADAIVENKSSISGLLFELIQYYDDTLFGHQDFVPGLINYLRSDDVKLSLKAGLISSIKMPETSTPKIRSKLASCVLEIIFKAHGTKSEDIGTLLEFFSRNFLEKSKSRLDFAKTLPDIEKRDVFIKLAKDHEIVRGDKLRASLLAWAEGSKKKEDPKKK